MEKTSECEASRTSRLTILFTPSARPLKTSSLRPTMKACEVRPSSGRQAGARDTDLVQQKACASGSSIEPPAGRTA